MSFSFSFVPFLFITFLPSYFFVFVFCFSFFIFFVIFRPRLSPPMVLNSPHSYIFLPRFMKRIHTEDLIFKENRETIPHQSKKSVKQIGARKHFRKQEKAHAHKQKIRHTKQETMHPAPPIGVFFCLPTETEKAVFIRIFYEFTENQKEKKPFSLIFYNIFVSQKHLFCSCSYILQQKYSKTQKTGHKSPKKAQRTMIFPYFTIYKEKQRKIGTKSARKSQYPARCSGGVKCRKTSAFSKNKKKMSKKTSKKRAKNAQKEQNITQTG